MAVTTRVAPAQAWCEQNAEDKSGRQKRTASAPPCAGFRRVKAVAMKVLLAVFKFLKG